MYIPVKTHHTHDQSLTKLGHFHLLVSNCVQHPHPLSRCNSSSSTCMYDDSVCAYVGVQYCRAGTGLLTTFGLLCPSSTCTISTASGPEQAS